VSGSDGVFAVWTDERAQARQRRAREEGRRRVAEERSEPSNTALLLVAHGTRDPAGAAVIDALAAAVGARLPGVRVAVAYADVRAPDVTTALRSLPDPVVVVPAFLAAGYHVRVDVPAQIARSGRPAIRTPPLGPALAGAAYERLVEAGWRRGDPVVLAAAGSSDPEALAEVEAAAARLGHLLGDRVRVGYAATAEPRIDHVVATTPGRVAVASWLLAPGRFHRIAARSGAATVTAPIGDHPLAVDLIVARYCAAKPAVA
jgi:sirohydrochlorin ferrochelatase